MSRDNIFYTVCGFLLGLVIGGLLIGPRVAKSRLAGQSVGESAATSPDASPAASAPPMGGNAMETVRRQLETLKAQVATNPNDFNALAQLGNLYMDAAKYPQAIEYYERALSVQDNPELRTDLGICYKQNNQPEKSLAAFEQVTRANPAQWQALFNQVILLTELHRVAEAKPLLERLKQLRPNDPEVQKLEGALSGK